MRAHVPIALLLAAVLAGAFYVPIQPLYASSDSMAPAIETGDLYFVYTGGAVRTGDVVAFESSVRDELVTHRIIGQKAAGYITKGDANPTSDQAAGHPVVSRSAVLGTVVEINGRPVTVAGAGPVAERLADYRQVLLGLAVLLVVGLAASGIFGDDRSVPRRSVLYVNDVVIPLFAGSVLVCLLFVFWGASTHELNYVATAGSVTATHTVPVGEAAVRTVAIDTYSLPFTTVIVEADGVGVLERTATATGLDLLVRVPAQSTLGLYQASVHVSTYPATLPRGAIVWLHEVHWLAAALGTIAPLVLPVYLVYAAFVDGRMPVRPPTGRWFRRVGGF